MLTLQFSVEGGVGPLLRPNYWPVNQVPVGQLASRRSSSYSHPLPFAGACRLAQRGCLWKRKSRMLILLFPVEGGVGPLLRPDCCSVNPVPIGQLASQRSGLCSRALAFAGACWLAQRGCIWNRKSGMLILLFPVEGGVGALLRLSYWPVNPFSVGQRVSWWLDLYSGALAFAGACRLAQRGCIWNRKSGMLILLFLVEEGVGALLRPK